MKLSGVFRFMVILLGASLQNAHAKDACNLLTKAEVSQVLGQPVTGVESKGLGGVCSFKTKDLNFELTVMKSGGAKYMNDLKAKLGDKAPNIPGIGDEALYNPFSYTLIARKSDAIYLFMMGDTSYKLTDANKLSIKKAMAKRLFSH